MFTIDSKAFGNATLLTLYNASTGANACIVPEYGAMLHSLQLVHLGKIHTIIEGCKASWDWSGKVGAEYSGAILFPFPSTVNNTEHAFEERRYTIQAHEGGRKHDMHGWVYDKPFSVLRETVSDDMAELWLEFTPKNTLPGYPFHVRLVVIYRLRNNKLEVAAKVYNLDHKPVPLGIGWQPYFKLNNKKIDALKLWLPQGRRVVLNDSMPASGELECFKGHNELQSIGGKTLDLGLKLSGEVAVTTLTDEEDRLSLHIWQHVGTLGYLKVHTPKDRSSIAIEPQSCATDAFNNITGLQKLKPGANYNCTWGVTLA